MKEVIMHVKDDGRQTSSSTALDFVAQVTSGCLMDHVPIEILLNFTGQHALETPQNADHVLARAWQQSRVADTAPDSPCLVLISVLTTVVDDELQVEYSSPGTTGCAAKIESWSFHLVDMLRHYTTVLPYQPRQHTLFDIRALNPDYANLDKLFTRLAMSLYCVRVSQGPSSEQRSIQSGSASRILLSI